jgi:hypothetical protein
MTEPRPGHVWVPSAVIGEPAQLVPIDEPTVRLHEVPAGVAAHSPVSGPQLGPPDQHDVDELRELLDMMESFSSNDQRARYLLGSNWLRDRGAAAAARLGVVRMAAGGDDPTGLPLVLGPYAQEGGRLGDAR